MEEVDVAIVGAGVSGLSVALALHKVNPRLRIKVMESRVAPTGKYGGFVKLQPNGLKAAAAISPKLLAGLRRIGLHEKKTLLHGEDGRLITRLDSHEDFAPAPDESLEPAGPPLSRLSRGAATTGLQYTFSSAIDEEEEEQLAQSSSTRNRRNGHQHRANRAGPSNLARTESQALVENRKWHNIDESSPNVIVGWTELERLLLSLLPEHTVEYQAQFLKYHESEGGVVALFEGLAYPLRARVLLGCDGPFSNVRAQCVQDSEPAYDRTVKWVGRLDGHQVSTIPLDYSAWWVKKGQMFVSHPLADGDVGWEALVTDRQLEAAGYLFDESTGRVLPSDPGQTREIKEKGQLSEMPPSQALGEVFQGWPRSVDQMVRFTPPEAVLEGGVFIRRPTGQDSNMALEDAAELAAFVQEFGVTKEALRRYDVARRPRWRHVMQLSLTQGAMTTTGIALTQGFINYTQDLYQRDFTPLGKNAKRQAERWSKGQKLQQRSHFWRSLRRLFTLGVLTTGVLLGANLLPGDAPTTSTDIPTPSSKDGKNHSAVVVESVEDDAPEEVRTARRVVRRTGALLRSGAHKLAGATRSAWRAATRSRPGQIATHEVQVASHAVGHSVEDATATALDTATTVVSKAAKKTIKHRVADALGAF